MPFIDREGNSLYYEDSGAIHEDESGPAIVFSHGAFLDHTIWEPVVAALAPAHRCITWDARGHGNSEKAVLYSWSADVRDAAAVLDSCGMDRVVVLGHSKGGGVVLGNATEETSCL